MSKFEKGEKIKNTITNEIGYIIEIYPPRRGRQWYKVKYDDRESDELSSDLIANVDLTDPFARASQNYFDHYTEYLKGNTVFKIHSSNNSTISSLKASRTLFRPYQFIPLLKFMNSDNKRILIADEVGLGKTIEAGHIMMELKARGELHNALVICPRSLCAKWATELSEKFGFEFSEIDNKKTLIHELQYHNGNVMAVTNYEKLRENSEILKTIEEREIKFSIIICDESHRLRNSGTLNYKGAERLLLYTQSAVFMSATPIMIDTSNLYNQLHLLDPNMYDNEEVFINNLELNRPFVRALSQLSRGESFKNIAQELSTREITTFNTINDIETTHKFLINDYFKDYPIYQEIMQILKDGKETNSLKAQLQFDLSEMSPMNNIFSRTRKREVTRDWSQAERNPYTHRVSLTAEERNAYEETIENYLYEHSVYDEYGREWSGNMGLVTVKRQLASSVWGYLNTNSNLDRGIDAYSDYTDSKFEKLLTIIQTVLERKNNKIIVFAIFKKTLKYLNLRLQKAGYKCVVIYGDPSINKVDELNKFQHDDSIQILLSSEVGSEGLDMQFCNTLVNYDLPWNPMVVEQRIGRIDRFGQASPKVNINTIVVEESILEDIYERLLMRIGIFRESIGDLEAILDLEMSDGGKKVTIKEALKSMERDFYSDKLTPQEAERKKIEIERAIENERLHLEKIEEGLTNTLTNDSYFRDEIRKIDSNNAYVTRYELYQFVLQILKDYLKTCELKQTSDPEVYVLQIPKSSPNVVKHFLEQYQPSDNDGKKLFRNYLTEIEDQVELKMTFEQDRAFKDKKLSYINIYHPIIRAGVRMYESNKDKTKCTFFFELKSHNLPKAINSGLYMLAIYKISVSRILFGRPVVTDSLYPILYDVDDAQLIRNQDLAESFMGRAQVDGQYAPLEESYKFDSETMEELRFDLNDYIREYIHDYRENLQTRIDNSKKLRYQQTIQYYDSRKKSFEKAIVNQELILESALSHNDNDEIKKAESALRILRASLRNWSDREKIDLERINSDVNLKITQEIKSLNLVKVI